MDVDRGAGSQVGLQAIHPAPLQSFHEDQVADPVGVPLSIQRAVLLASRYLAISRTGGTHADQQVQQPLGGAWIGRAGGRHLGRGQASRTDGVEHPELGGRHDGPGNSGA